MTNDPVATKTQDRDWLTVAAAMFGLIFNIGSLTIYSFGVFVRPLHTEFGWTRLQLAGALTVSQLVMAVTIPLWGAMLDRLGPRPILIFAVVSMSLLIASLSALTPHLWHFYLIFAALPVLAAGVSPFVYAAVLIQRFKRHLGLALGLATMGMGLGGSIIPVLLQTLISELGWRRACVTLACIIFIIAMPAALVATRRTRSPLPRAAGSLARPWLPSVRTRTFFFLCLIIMLLGVTTVGVLVHLIPMMTDRGYTSAAAARVTALAGLAGLFSRGAVGWVLDKAEASFVVATVASLAAVAILLLSFAGAGPSDYIAAALLGAAVGAEVNFITYLPRLHFDSGIFGRLCGIESGLFFIGTALGPLVLGTVLARTGSYEPGLLLFAVLALIAAGAAFGLPRSGRRIAALPDEKVLKCH